MACNRGMWPNGLSVLLPEERHLMRDTSENGCQRETCDVPEVKACRAVPCPIPRNHAVAINVAVRIISVLSTSRVFR